MKSRFAAAIAGMGVAAAAMAFASTDDKKPKVPTEVKCAVLSDTKVTVVAATEKGLFADSRGYRYYFCCEGCPAAFKKEPAKYASSENIPVALAPTPARLPCAVMPTMKATVKDAIVKKAMGM